MSPRHSRPAPGPAPRRGLRPARFDAGLPAGVGPGVMSSWCQPTGDEIRQAGTPDRDPIRPSPGRPSLLRNGCVARRRSLRRAGHVEVSVVAATSSHPVESGRVRRPFSRCGCPADIIGGNRQGILRPNCRQVRLRHRGLTRAPRTGPSITSPEGFLRTLCGLRKHTPPLTGANAPVHRLKRNSTTSPSAMT